MAALSEDQRSALLQSKLAALVGERAAQEFETGPFLEGATLVDSNGDAFILLEEDAPPRVGAALTWAATRGVGGLTLVTSAGAEPAGVAARQAGLTRVIRSVERIEGTSLVPVMAAEFPPRPGPAATVLAEPALQPLLAILRDADLEVVVEHGRVLGEVLGLEVARIVRLPGGEWHLEVGVGRLDREMSAMMFAHLPTTESVGRAAGFVRGLRRAGAAPHPLRDLVPSRWLRSELCARPDQIGAARLEPVDCSRVAANLRETQSAAAVGEDTAGRPLLVVCSGGGTDLEAPVVAAETRAWLSPEAELVLAIPGRVSRDVLERSAGLLTRPPQIRVVRDPW